MPNRNIIKKALLGSISLLSKLILAFKDRVSADLGTFEAETCLNTTVQSLVTTNLYDSASLILTPNAYKAGKIYSLKGSDFTFTRASTATRIDSAGNIENLATGVPALEYPSCPSWAIWLQRTNLFLNSATLATQSVTVTATPYVVTFYGTGTITFSGAYIGSLVGTGANNRVSLVFTPTVGVVLCTVIGSVTFAQIENATIPSSYIPTTGATATRLSDNVTQTRTFTANSTTYIKTFLNSGSLSNSLVYAILDIRTAGNNRYSLYRFNNTIQLDIVNTSVLFSGTILTLPTLVLNTVYKIAIVTTATTLIVYINGVAVYTNNSVAVPVLTGAALSYGNLNGITQWNGLLGELEIWDSAFNSAAAIALTT